MTPIDRQFVGACVALMLVGFVIFLFADKHRLTYQSNTALTHQISYCYFKGPYTVKHGKHKGERWYKDGYLPCYFIPHKENI